MLWANAEWGMRNAECPGEVVAPRDLKERTKMFALAVVDLVEHLPNGANYRSACRARSRKEFIAKMGIVEEEADETQFWLDLVVERGLGDAERVSPLREEARQLVAITVSSIRTARRTSMAIPHSAFRVPH